MKGDVDAYIAAAPKAAQPQLRQLRTTIRRAAPKAVVHDERSIGASMELLRDRLQLTAGDVVFSSELYLNVPALMAGARSVISGFARVDPSRWLRQARTFRATVAFSVPSDMVRIVEAAARDGHKLPAGLRLLLLGSAPAHRQFLERLRAVVEPSTADNGLVLRPVSWSASATAGVLVAIAVAAAFLTAASVLIVLILTAQKKYQARLDLLRYAVEQGMTLDVELLDNRPEESLFVEAHKRLAR